MVCSLESIGTANATQALASRIFSLGTGTWDALAGKCKAKRRADAGGRS